MEPAISSSMGIWVILIGLVIGAIAKLVMPGKDPGGPRLCLSDEDGRPTRTASQTQEVRRADFITDRFMADQLLFGEIHALEWQPSPRVQ